MGIWSWLFGSRQEPARRAEEPRLAPPPHSAQPYPDEPAYPAAPPRAAEDTPFLPEQAPEPVAEDSRTMADPELAPDPAPQPEPPMEPLPPPKWVAPSYLIPRLPPVGSTPITRRMLSAMQAMGFDATGWTEEQARIVLAARDYFEALFAELGKPPGRYKEVRLACIRDLVASARLHEPLLAWAAQDGKREQEGPRELGPPDLHQAARTVWQRAMDRG
ncbi:hypothetical protein [Roseomonas chloroacetimidivorans]|jgi:hypothetical protein|uniref:hypothetical protein n=1 Tax=Roseomonas chloroacetimidivorans TaxID=1766656 RepID=UPI003C713870